MHRLITATQVADLLNLGRRAFLARRRWLEAEHDFPPPVRGLPDRWDPTAIEAWLAGQRDATAAPPETTEAILIARARAATA